MERECECGGTRKPTKRTLKDGRVVFGLWCLDCGSWLAAKSNLFRWDTKFEQFDESLRDAIWRAHREQYKVKQQQREAERQQRERFWWEQYNTFIHTSVVWQKQRAKALVRDNHLCQCCREHEATEVHHLRYPTNAAYLEDVPLWDLQSVCKECHDQIHELKDRGILR